MKTKSNSQFAFFNPRALIGFALYAAGLVLAFGAMSSVAAGDNAAAELSQSVPTQPPDRWKVTGDLITARSSHTATLLPNGQVLVAGGLGNSDYLASAELYDPATGMWTATGSLAAARYAHTATLLLNGQVLVAGGYGNVRYLRSAELYDPASGMWTATQDFVPGRANHAATLLHGRVLVSGGYNFDEGGALAQAEVYKSAP